MSPAEASMFEAFLREANQYLEFGAGGSTCLAASLVRKRIVSVDSSISWLDQVRVATNSDRVQLHFVDVGPVGDWGRPLDEGCRDRWPAYSQSVWNDVPESIESDLYLIDGRFRVACFAEVIARAKPGAIVLFHDFANRDIYHVVKPLASTIATVETLTAFVKDQCADVSGALAIAKQYRCAWN